MLGAVTMLGRMVRGGRVDHSVGQILDGSRQHPRVRGGRSAGQDHGYRGSGSGQASATNGEPTASPAF